MKTQNAISALKGFRHEDFKHPNGSRSSIAASKLEKLDFDSGSKAPVDVDGASDRIRAAFRAGALPNAVDLKQASWCLWDGERPLSHDLDIVKAYLTHIWTTKDRKEFQRLATVYVTRFPSHSPILTLVGGILREMAKSIPGPWAKASELYDIFDPAKGPGAIAATARAEGVPLLKTLSQIGVKGLSAESGLLEAAFADVLRQIEVEITEPLIRLHEIQRWRPPFTETRPWWNQRGLIADILVMSRENSAPQRSARNVLLTFLLEQYGDPRIDDENWTPMRSASLVRSWLNERSLTQFLDVVGSTVVAVVKQWKYHRAFWIAVQRRGLISDISVIYDSVGAERADQISGVPTSYATWLPGGSKPIERGHACLIARVGEGVIADWSHNGKCNIWRDGASRFAPRFHKEGYTSDEVLIGRGSSSELDRQVDYTHSGSETYFWQKTLAEEIFGLTGVMIPPREYIAL